MDQCLVYRSRRSILTFAANGLAYGILTSVRSAFGHSVSLSPLNPNANKFASDRTVHPFAGNTVICFLPKDSLIFRELVRVHDEFASQEFAKRLALLPPSSYHTTIFSGANDQERRPNVWPADIPFNTPMAECSRILAEQLSKIQFVLSLPLRFRIDAAPQSQSKDISTIRLLPLDDAEARKLRELRNRLSEVTKIHAPDHDRYRFHISLGYWVQPRTREEAADYNKALSMILARLTQKIHSIDLQVPQFCTFEDMLAYSPVEPLSIAPGRSIRETGSVAKRKPI